MFQHHPADGLLCEMVSFKMELLRKVFLLFCAPTPIDAHDGEEQEVRIRAVDCVTPDDDEDGRRLAVVEVGCDSVCGLGDHKLVGCCVLEDPGVRALLDGRVASPLEPSAACAGIPSRLGVRPPLKGGVEVAVPCAVPEHEVVDCR